MVATSRVVIKSYLPKETLDLKRKGKSQTFPLKHAIVSDASNFSTSTTEELPIVAFSSPYHQRAMQAEALAREIEAGHRIRYTPGETLVARNLLSPLQTQLRIAEIERDYFPDKRAFLEASHKKVERARPISRGSISEFNAYHLPSEGFESDSEFLAGPSNSNQYKTLHSSIQHWPSQCNASATKPKLLQELEKSLQTGLQVHKDSSSAEFNLNALALYNDVFDRYIQHTGIYKGLLASIKDIYDQALSFMFQKVSRFSHAYESLQFFESRVEVVLDKIISEYRSKLRQKDDLLRDRDERIRVLEHSIETLQSKSASQTIQFEALTQQKNKFEKALTESLKYNDSTTHRMLDLQTRCEDVALIRNRARKSEDLCKNAIIDRDECRSALEEFRALPARIKMLEREKDALETKLSLQEAASKVSTPDLMILVELDKDSGLPFHGDSLSSSDGKVVPVNEILQLFANSKNLKFIGGNIVPNIDGSGFFLKLHSKTLSEDSGSLAEKRLLNVLSMIDRTDPNDNDAAEDTESEFPCLGSDPSVPDYLHSEEGMICVKNLKWDKGDVERMIDDFWTQRKSDASGLSLGQFVIKYFKNKHPMSVDMQVTARYNFIKSLALFVYDADFEMLKSCLEGRVIEEVVIAQKDFLISVTTHCNRFIDANCQGLKAIEKSEFFKIIRKLCPTKSDRDMDLLKDAMDLAQPGSYVQTSNLFASNEDGDQSEFAEALRDQFLEERLRYLSLIESTLNSICASSRSAVVTAADIKTMFGSVDPNKPIVDVRQLIQKGFGTIRDVSSIQSISVAEFVNNLRQTMCSTSTKWQNC